jgi:cystathionine beta-lyase/cystathionine gamma-synthase
MEEKVEAVRLDTLAVHAGDRKTGGAYVPVTTPIHTATSFFYDSAEALERVFAGEMQGPNYSRHGNPTNEALEELVAALEAGGCAMSCGSGMAALNLAITAALLDRPRVILAASALYGATINMLVKVLAPSGVDTVFVDFNDEQATAAAIAEHKPGAMLMETISNPLLRVAPLDRIAAMAKAADVPLIVDSTFATPLLVKPLELGATFVVHSLTKYLAGHGDVLGGIVVADKEHLETLQSLSRALGPVLGPFEAYLTMRGIKTFPLRMERQCGNACKVASFLASHPAVERVHFPANPSHPDAAIAKRIFAPNLYGAMVSFETKDADHDRMFRLMNSFRVIVPATSLGDVHSMASYPVMSSHRELSPKHRARLGIQDNLLRLSIGIEAVEDIIGDLDRALRG